MRSLSELWPRPPHTTKPAKTAFVLSGGAAMGALQVGMLRALIERRIVPDLIVGCSIGAINGVVLAGGANLATVGRMQDVWMDLIDRELVPTGLLPSPVQLVRKGESISSNEAMRTLLEEIVPVRTFDQLEIDFSCVATDIDDATGHWFTEGDLVDAVLASSAIPAVFPPVMIDGVRYLDGGIVDDVPVRRAVEAGATRIFVLQVGEIERPRPEMRRPLDAAFLAYWIARRHRLIEDLERIPDDVEVIILPHGNPEPVRYNDLSSSAHLMDIAYRAGSEYLEAWIAGTAPPSLGPLRTVPVDDEDEPADADDPSEFETARRLLDSAKALIGLGDQRDRRGTSEADGPGVAVSTVGPTDRAGGFDSTADAAASTVSEADDGAGEDGDQAAITRLVERAESLGPAMRALVDRVLERRGAAPDRPEPDESVD